jgi:phage tail-like protein
MTSSAQRLYRFATQAQWSAGLFDRIDLEAFATNGGIAPFTPYSRRARVFPSVDARAPAAAPNGEVLWRDSLANLYRLDADHGAPLAIPAPPAVANASRIVATRSSIWVATSTSLALQCFDRERLTSRFVVALSEGRVLDIAGDGCDGLWALLEANGLWRCLRVDCAGVERDCFEVRATAPLAQITYARRYNSIVLLAANGEELYWFVPGHNLASLSLRLDSVRACFKATALGGDARSRVVVSGIDGAAYGGSPQVLCFDGDGDLLGNVELQVPATGINATATELLVTTADGLLLLGGVAGESELTISAETECAFVTPALQSPLNDNPRRWLRVEALAGLPPGTTLEISYAATDDPNIRDQANHIAADSSIPAAQRLSRLRNILGVWQSPMALQGSGAQGAAGIEELVAPLFDVQQPYLWIRVRLIATPGATMPVLRELRVLYPGNTLMQYLPAIYQRQEAQAGDFLRVFVGVLESTTQSLDARIASLGTLIDPATAPVAWLDYVARWLGLPWDDGLETSQKRALLTHANDLASQRGTRRGLTILLDCLFPGVPVRYRLVDFTADFGFATVGGTTCKGTALPTLLGGLPASSATLGRRALVGRARLPCASDPDDGISHLVGRVEVHVMASAKERRLWEDWLPGVVETMVPAAAHLRVRWSSPAQRLWNNRLDESLSLLGDPLAQLGSDAVTGVARLPEGRGLTLTPTGLDLGGRLQ